MEKIPTVEEFMKGKEFSIPSIQSMMIEFAKLHVKQSLLQAFSKAEISGEWGGDSVLLDEIQTRDQDGSWMDLRVDRKSILTSYPLENIV